MFDIFFSIDLRLKGPILSRFDLVFILIDLCIKSKHVFILNEMKSRRNKDIYNLYFFMIARLIYI